MTEYVEAWQCIGCGRLEAPEPCIGVCQDRKVELVYAAEHEVLRARLARTREELKAFESVMRRLARTTPHDGEWASSYRVLQEQARRALAASARAAAAPERAAASPGRRGGRAADPIGTAES